ncbi:hypothetical protein PSN45_004374 [Yamadazyma tenuis]|uniref:uncharacterized protein n=1 Tax=Candida tenuis TaxID=2315449 RepID=UPI00279DE0FB|nr:hypothetical protein PSN45_004374 [Yamadazyma tenuis]
MSIETLTPVDFLFNKEKDGEAPALEFEDYEKEDLFRLEDILKEIPFDELIKRGSLDEMGTPGSFTFKDPRKAKTAGSTTSGRSPTSTSPNSTKSASSLDKKSHSSSKKSKLGSKPSNSVNTPKNFSLEECSSTFKSANSLDIIREDTFFTNTPPSSTSVPHSPTNWTKNPKKVDKPMLKKKRSSPNLEKKKLLKNMKNGIVNFQLNS